MSRLENIYQKLSAIEATNPITKGLIQLAQSIVSWLGRVIYKIDVTQPKTPCEQTAAVVNQIAVKEVETWNIEGRTLDGRTIFIPIKTNQTLATLCELAAQELEWAPEDLKIIFMGRNLGINLQKLIQDEPDLKTVRAHFIFSRTPAPVEADSATSSLSSPISSENEGDIVDTL